MAAVVSLNGIDEAIKNLDYKAKDSPKLRLIQAIRAKYPDEIALATPPAIDPDILVTAVWGTVPDENRLRSRRKNLASIRSSVNQDLKALFAKGKNPDGIIISPSNTFVMSDEAKDQMLTSVAASVGKDSLVSLGQITRTLSLIEDLLARTERFPGNGQEDGESGLRRLKEIVKQISERIDLKVGDGGSNIASGNAFHRGDGLGSSPGQGGPGDKAAGLGNSLPGLQNHGFSETDGESRGPGSDPVGEDDFIPEETRDEQADIEDVEIIEEPEDLEVVDETPTEGSGDSRGKDGLGAVDGSGRGLDGEEGFEQEGFGGGTNGPGVGNSEFGLDHSGLQAGDPTISEGTQEAPGSSGGSGVNQIGAGPGASGLAGPGNGAEGPGGESTGSGYNPIGGGDFIPEETLDEQADIEDVEILEEPESLEIMDERSAQGPGGSTVGDMLGTADKSGQGLAGKEGLEQEGVGREPVGAGHGDPEWPGKGEETPGGAKEAQGSPNDSGSDQVGAPLKGEQGPGEGLCHEVSGLKSGGPDSARAGEDDFISERNAEEEDLDEVEVIDEPEDLVAEEEELDEVEEAVVEDGISSEDETPDLETGPQGLGPDADIIATGEGGRRKGVGQENGEGPNVPVPGDPDQAHPGNAGPQTATAHGGSPDLYGQSDLEALDLDEVLEEEDGPDMEVLEETGQPGTGNGEGFGSELGLGPAVEPSDGDPGRAPTPAPEMGLPLGSLGLDSFEDASEAHGGTQKADHEVLAEAFDGYLGAMERFYNQYIRIPKGAYTIGGGPAPHGIPESRVRLPEFYMGKFPITNALFEIFVEKTGYRTTAEKEGYGLVYYPRRKREADPKTGRARHVWNSALLSQRVDGACWYQPLGPGSTLHRKRNHPVVQVTLEDAAAFAAWTGKRLPSEPEWEAASRSRDGRLYPWGDMWRDDRCNVEETQVGDTTPVDAYVEAEGPLGIADTLGNVMEWTLDMDQTGENTERPCYIVKGGSWASTSDLRLCNRFSMPPDARSNILGFRCVAF